MRNKLRILHIIPNFGHGGAERLVVDLMKAIDREQFEVAAVSLYPKGDTILEQELEDNGLKVYFLNKHLGLDLHMIPQLCRVFRTFRPDVVHTHLSVLRYALLPMLLFRVPVRVHTVHNVAQKEVDRIGKLVHWIAFQLCGVVPVSISQEVARTVRSVYGRGVGTPVIYNGIFTERFASISSQNKLKVSNNIVLLHVGRFAPQKNHMLLVEAFSRALKEYSSMELWLVGDGPLRPAVEDAVRERGMERSVVFWGIVPKVEEVLEETDIFVLSSDWEGLPLVALEAMAAGKPVISTNVGGVPELVENGVTGFLVPPKDPDALTNAILRLARDPQLRKQMGLAAKRHAIERFDISRTIRLHEDLYLKLWRRNKG